MLGLDVLNGVNNDGLHQLFQKIICFDIHLLRKMIQCVSTGRVVAISITV